MKKVILSLAVLFSVAMVSCGGNKAAEAVDTDTIVSVEVATALDSIAPDSVIAETAVAVAAGVATVPAGK
ncbi:MAG: hypothetical protein HDR88_00915 [Bacteroides sp.]|nr:hypothetical protein [Bacteroides sp.]